MTNMLKISQSKAKCWRRCKFEFFCKYVLELERRLKTPPLITGTVIHEVLEAMAYGRKWEPIIKEYEKQYNKLFLEEQDKYKSPDDLRTIMKGYKKYWAHQPLQYIKVNGKLAEHEFEVKLTTCDAGDIMFEGTIDAYVKDEQSRRWLKENKSFKRMPAEEVRFTDVQSTSYTWVMEELGFKVDGLLWEYICTKVPTVPEVLKNGGLSKRMNIDSTYETYYGEIMKHGLNPEDYTDILDNLKGKEDKFYRRIWMPSPRPIIKAVVQELKETALEIAYLGESLKSRNIGIHCKQCSYYALCQADLRGLDKEFIIEREYQPRRKEDTNEEKTEDDE